MARVLPCGGFNRSSLLQSNNTGFEIQAILSEIISCPPSPSHQIWVTCSHRFAIPFSSLQGLSYRASVPGHPGLPCWHTPCFRSCRSHLGQPGNTCIPIWNHESASSHKELNFKAVKLLAALWAQPLPNKVKLVQLEENSWHMSQVPVGVQVLTHTTGNSHSLWYIMLYTGYTSYYICFSYFWEFGLAHIYT